VNLCEYRQRTGFSPPELKPRRDALAVVADRTLPHGATRLYVALDDSLGANARGAGPYAGELEAVFGASSPSVDEWLRILFSPIRSGY
jgi:hypothetical protein